MIATRHDAVRIVAPSIGEIAQLADIERRAAGLFSETDLPLALRADTVPERVLTSALERNLLRVAVSAEGVLGFALAERHGDGLHLAEVSVAPEFARRGIGGRLVSAILDIARGSGASAVTLTTFDHLPWNRPFYERFGFRTVPAERRSRRLHRLLADERSTGLSKRVAMEWRPDPGSSRAS